MRSKKRRRVAKSKATVEDSDLEGETPIQPPAPEKERPAKRSKRQEYTATLPPQPCQRCVESQHTCEPNGWRMACVRCHHIRQTCTHAKLYPPVVGPPKRRIMPPPPLPTIRVASRDRAVAERAALEELSKSGICPMDLYSHAQITHQVVFVSLPPRQMNVSVS